MDQERRVIIVEHTMSIALQFILTFGQFATNGNSTTSTYVKQFINLSQIRRYLKTLDDWYFFKLALLMYAYNVFMTEKKIEQSDLLEIQSLILDELWYQLERFNTCLIENNQPNPFKKYYFASPLVNLVGQQLIFSENQEKLINISHDLSWYQFIFFGIFPILERYLNIITNIDENDQQILDDYGDLMEQFEQKQNDILNSINNIVLKQKPANDLEQNSELIFENNIQEQFSKSKQFSKGSKFFIPSIRQKKFKEPKTLAGVKELLEKLQKNITSQLKLGTITNLKIYAVKEQEVRATEHYLRSKQAAFLFTQENISSVNEEEQKLLFQILQKYKFGQSLEKNKPSKQLKNLMKVLEMQSNKENQYNVMILLKGLINSSNKNSEEQEQRQTEFLSAGFLDLLCKSISINNKALLISQYIEVLCYFLRSGKVVQEQFYNYIEQDFQNLFILQMNKYIHTNFTQLFEFESNLKSLNFIQKVQNTKHIVISTCEIAAQSEPQLEQFTNLVNEKKKACISSLELFRLACEGHNLKMQQFLKKQYTRNGKLHQSTRNMISFFAKIAMNYLGVMNQLNVEVGEKIIELLIEVMQGPCENNQIILSQTNLLEYFEDFLLDLRQFKANSQSAEQVNSIIEEFSKLCDLISIFKLTLFEGNNDKLILNKLSAYFVPELIFERLAYLRSKKRKITGTEDNVWMYMYSTIYLKDKKKNKSCITQVYDVFPSNQQKTNQKELIPDNNSNYIIHFAMISGHQLMLESQENISNFENLEAQTRFTQDEMHEHFERECYNAIILIKSLQDPHPELKDQLSTYFSVPDNKPMLKAKRFYSQGTLAIEIMNAKNKLERIYFQKPAACKYLSQLSQTEFLESVNRENINEKLNGLLGEIEYFENEMFYFKWLKNRYSLTFSLTYFSCLRYFSLFLSIVINMIILCKSPPDDWSEISVEVRVLGIILLIIQFLVYAIYLIFKFPLDFKRGQGKLSTFKKNFKMYYYSQFMLYLIGSTSVVYFSFNVLFCFLAIELNQALYSLLLLQMIEMSPILRNVIKSITLNLQQLGLTLCLGIVLIYQYAIISYSSVTFRDKMEYSENEEMQFCSSPLKCFSFFLNNGLRSGGGIADILTQLDYDEDGSMYIGRIFYDLSFFIIIIIIWMNIIFGIIIDTFAALRDEKNMRDNDENNKCFICGIDRGAFESVGIQFKKHKKRQHILWNYAYFIIHLNLKDTNSFNGTEAYVNNKKENNDISWFPIDRSIALEKLQKKPVSEVQEEK